MWEELINEVEKTNLSFDEFLALYKIYSYEKNSLKINYNSDMFNTYLELEGKNLIKVITNEDEILTFHLREGGTELIENFLKLKNKSEIKTENPVETNKEDNKKTNQYSFEEFWMIFPSSDEHGIYKKTRVLKAAKEACRKKYFNILLEGVSHKDIIKALKYEIKLRKDGSNKGNNLTYMKNSLTWLNQKEFEVILETMSDDNDSNSNSDWTSNVV